MVTTSTNPFIGPARPLKGLQHGSWGALLVVFQNGKPITVVKPGERVARAFRTRFIGDMEIAELNGGLVNVKMNLTNIPTSDRFTILRLALQAQLQLNEWNDFQTLKSFLQTSGPAFGEALVTESRVMLERIVRDAIRLRTADEIFDSALSDLVRPVFSGVSTGDAQVLRLRNLVISDVQWPENFLTVRHSGAEIAAIDARLDIAKAEQEGTIEFEKDQTVAEIELGRLRAAGALDVESLQARKAGEIYDTRVQSFVPIALQLGVDPMTLADPARHHELTQNAHQLLIALLDPANRGVITRQPEIFQSLFVAAGMSQLGQHTAISTGPTRTIDADPSGDSPAGASIALALGSRSGTKGLSIDRRLLRVWAKTAGGRVDVSGLAYEKGPEYAMVIAVGNPDAVIPTTNDETELASALGVAEIRVLSLRAGSTQDVVGQWFDALMRGLPGDLSDIRCRSRATPSDQGDDLSIFISGPAQQAKLIAGLINSSENPFLGALENLLPHSSIVFCLDDRPE